MPVVSVKMYTSQVTSARKEMERARDKQAKEEAKAAKLAGEGAKLRERAAATKSESMASGFNRQAATKEKDALKVTAAAAGFSKAVASAQTKLHKAEAKLAEAGQTAERKQSEREARERKARETKERQERQREQRAARQREQADAREAARQRQELARLQAESSGLRAELEAVSRRVAPPEITVLFWASSPEDQAQLRLDKEMREIEKRVRMSDHRESIRFEYRVARQLGDLIQDLNQVKPHIVHFSGHGSQAGLAFEDDSGAYQPLPNDALAALLRATSGRIRLAVFNSCESATQAELATENIEFAIGMGASVEDKRAQTFAGQFYNSLGFGLTLETAFEQAQTAVKLEHGDGSEIPRLFAAPGADAAATVLVDPGA